MNIEQLIVEAKKGSKAAEEKLFMQLSDFCFASCICYLKNKEDAEERMMDGMFKFFMSLKSFKYESDSKLYACLQKIMMRECMMQLRNTKVIQIVGEPTENDDILDEDLLNKFSESELSAIINQLPVGARTVFNLHVMDEVPHWEIANMQGITIGTSKSQLARAKTLLKQSLLKLKKNYEELFTK